jgi:hypothetical protein
LPGLLAVVARRGGRVTSFRDMTAADLALIGHMASENAPMAIIRDAMWHRLGWRPTERQINAALNVLDWQASKC